MKVEVVYALPAKCIRRELGLAAGTTLREAIASCGILDEYPELASALEVGVFGQRRGLDTAAADGDRIEIYRPLVIEPGEARRRRGRARA